MPTTLKNICIFAEVIVNFRSSRREVLCKKCVLKSFAKFTRKHRCQILFFNKVAGLRPATLLKKRHWHKCFPVNFEEIFWSIFFYRTPPMAASVIFNIYLHVYNEN